MKTKYVKYKKKYIKLKGMGEYVCVFKNKTSGLIYHVGNRILYDDDHEYNQDDIFTNLSVFLKKGNVYQAARTILFKTVSDLYLNCVNGVFSLVDFPVEVDNLFFYPAPDWILAEKIYSNVYTEKCEKIKDKVETFVLGNNVFLVDDNFIRNKKIIKRCIAKIYGNCQIKFDRCKHVNEIRKTDCFYNTSDVSDINGITVDKKYDCAYYNKSLHRLDHFNLGDADKFTQPYMVTTDLCFDVSYDFLCNFPQNSTDRLCKELYLENNNTRKNNLGVFLCFSPTPRYSEHMYWLEKILPTYKRKIIIMLQAVNSEIVVIPNENIFNTNVDFFILLWVDSKINFKNDINECRRVIHHKIFNISREMI